MKLSQLSEDQKNKYYDLLTRITGWGDGSLASLVEGKNSIWGPDFDIYEFIKKEARIESVIGYLFTSEGI